MTIRPRRQVLNPDQIPLITPESSWEVPRELPDLTRVGEIALDTETKDEGLRLGLGPGWAARNGHVVGVGVAWRTGAEIQRIYVPVRHPETANFPKEQVARWVKNITRQNRVIFFNAGYDIGWLNADMNVPVPPLIDDASCMAVLIDETRRQGAGEPDSPYSLDGVARWCNVPGKDTAALREAAVIYGVPARDAVKNIWRLPARYAGPYGQQDPVTTLEIAEYLRPELARQGLLHAYSIEMRLTPIVHEMRKRGVRVDCDALETLRDGLFARRDRVLAELSSRLRARVGMDEIRSHGWLVKIFQMEGVPYNSKEGTASFEKDWMRAGFFERGGTPHWLPRMIAEAKQCHESASKFVQGYLLDYAHGGRIHATINQFKSEDGGARTHRFSYADPPLQQIPSRPEMFLDDWPITGEIATALRGAFLPEEGELWFAPDYSQQEYRLIVHYAELLGCTKAHEAGERYRSDPKTDFHNLVVDMTGLTRRRAKDVNFAKSYGAGVKKFAAMINASVEEATTIMGQYDTEMPFVKECNGRCEKAAQKNGYVKLLDGARVHFNYWEAAWLSREERERGWSGHLPMNECSLEEARSRASTKEHPWYGKRLKRAFTHKAMNAISQGGAARQTKAAMVAAHEDTGCVPMLQMHDELAYSLLDPAVGERIAACMRDVVRLRVPMMVDAEWGPTWGTAKHSHAGALAAAGLRRRRAAGRP